MHWSNLVNIWLWFTQSYVVLILRSQYKTFTKYQNVAITFFIYTCILHGTNYDRNCSILKVFPNSWLGSRSACLHLGGHSDSGRSDCCHCSSSKT